MKPKRIVLVRHGESEGNKDHTVYDRVFDCQVSLNELGRAQVRQTGRDLLREFGLTSANYNARPHIVNSILYVSPYLRTLQSADELVSAMGDFVISRREEPRLIEQFRGNIRTCTKEEYRVTEKQRYRCGPFFFRFDQGEAGWDVYNRCITFKADLFKDFEDADFPTNAILVTHSFTLRILLMIFLGLTVDQFHKLDDPRNAGYAILELGLDNKYHLRGNETWSLHEFNKQIKETSNV